LPSSKSLRPTTERPIVEIRAINYVWREDVDGVQWVARAAFRVEIRREGEKDWVEIPVVERASKPPG
jgi:hypothetical protein